MFGVLVCVTLLFENSFLFCVQYKDVHTPVVRSDEAMGATDTEEHTITYKRSVCVCVWMRVLVGVAYMHDCGVCVVHAVPIGVGHVNDYFDFLFVCLFVCFRFSDVVLTSMTVMGLLTSLCCSMPANQEQVVMATT